MTFTLMHRKPIGCVTLSLLCMLLPLSPAASAQTSALAESVPGSAQSEQAQIILWFDAAPLDLVITRLADISGRAVETDGVPLMRVSGRLNGSLEDALEALSVRHPVLFDVTDDTLSATSSEFVTNVSILAPSQDLDEAFKRQLLDHRGAGNQLEFRDDSVRVSGHPAFVGRTAMLINKTIIDPGLRDSTQGAMNSARSPAENPLPGAAATLDAGAGELLADIRDEAKAPAEQATLVRPIRWVTDIPGFDTF